MLVGCVVAVLMLVYGGAVGADVIDRVLAVVAGQPITLSDARAAVALGLIERTATPDPIAGALDKLIERELVLTEVRRYQPREPSLSQLQGRLEAIPKRFPDRTAYLRALTSTGMTEPRLEGWVRDDLRAEIYITERFATAAPPTEEELLRYYRDHEAQFTTAGRARAVRAGEGPGPRADRRRAQAGPDRQLAVGPPPAQRDPDPVWHPARPVTRGENWPQSHRATESFTGKMRETPWLRVSAAIAPEIPQSPTVTGPATV